MNTDAVAGAAELLSFARRLRRLRIPHTERALGVMLGAIAGDMDAKAAELTTRTSEARRAPAPAPVKVSSSRRQAVSTVRTARGQQVLVIRRRTSARSPTTPAPRETSLFPHSPENA